MRKMLLHPLWSPSCKLRFDLIILQFSGGNVIYGDSRNFVLEVCHTVTYKVNSVLFVVSA